METETGLIHCKLIAVHAGLERNKDVKEQLNFLRARDTRVPKVEALSGRKNVRDIPKVITFSLIIVSIEPFFYCYFVLTCSFLYPKLYLLRKLFLWVNSDTVV